jgi:hypothetical protein
MTICGQRQTTIVLQRFTGQSIVAIMLVVGLRVRAITFGIAV